MENTLFVNYRWIKKYPEKFEKLGFKEEPKAYNIDYKTLTNEEIGKGFGFEFGKSKALIDWIEESL